MTSHVHSVGGGVRPVELLVRGAVRRVLVCYDDTGVDGTAFRIDGDGSGAVLIDGPATLSAMENVGYTGDFETDQQAFYDALVEWDVEFLPNVDQTESGKFGVSRMENGAWYFHPADHDWFAFNSNDSFSEGFTTREAALQAAEEWEANEGDD